MGLPLREDGLRIGQPEPFLLGVPTRPYARAGVNGDEVVAHPLGVDQSSPDQSALHTPAAERGRRAVDVDVGHAAVLGLHEGESTAPGDLPVDAGQVEHRVGAQGSHLGQTAQERNGTATVLETGDGVVDEGRHAGLGGGGPRHASVRAVHEVPGLGHVGSGVPGNGELGERTGVDVEEAVDPVAADGEGLESTRVGVRAEQDGRGEVGRPVQVLQLLDIVVADRTLHTQPQRPVDLLAQEGDGDSRDAAANHPVDGHVFTGEQIHADLDLSRQVNDMGLLDVVDSVQVEDWRRDRWDRLGRGRRPLLLGDCSVGHQHDAITKGLVSRGVGVKE